MAYSLLIHDDTVALGDQAALLKHLVRSAPRGTVVVRTKDNQTVLMRYPLIAGNAGRLFLTYKNNLVYADDIQFIEAYDPHPDFDPEGV